MALVAPLDWSWKRGAVAVSDDALRDAWLDFLIDLDQAAIAAFPDDIDALSRLGETLTRRGRHEEGLAIDRRLVVLLPESATAHYNLACSLALTGRMDEAFTALEAAVEHGYDEPDHLEGDDDLALLRDDPRFQDLLDRLRTL